MAASRTKSTVTATLGRNGKWRWDWRSPNGTEHFGGGFETKKAALAAGRKKEREHARLFVIDPHEEQ